MLVQLLMKFGAAVAGEEVGLELGASTVGAAVKLHGEGAIVTALGARVTRAYFCADPTLRACASIRISISVPPSHAFSTLLVESLPKRCKTFSFPFTLWLWFNKVRSRSFTSCFDAEGVAGGSIHTSVEATSNMLEEGEGVETL